MLDILRSKSRSVLTYVLFGIIIVVFIVSFGPGSQGCQVEGLSAHSAVEIDGYVVAPADYEEAYGNLFRTYQARMGQTFTRELADQLGLRNVAMNQLVDRVLVVQEAKKRGLRVTPDEINRAVWAIPSFQTDGKFDIELYRRAVRQAYGSESRFEERLVDDLLYQKMMALIRENALVSEEEIRAAWLAESDRVNLSYVRFPIAAARKEVKVTDAEVAALLKSDAARVQKAYEANAARYDVKKKVKARHILVRVPEGAPAAQDEDAQEEGRRIRGAREEGALRPGGEGGLRGHRLPRQGRRPGLLRPRPHGQALRGRGLRAQARRGLRTGAHPLRLARHPGRGRRGRARRPAEGGREGPRSRAARDRGRAEDRRPPGARGAGAGQGRQEARRALPGGAARREEVRPGAGRRANRGPRHRPVQSGRGQRARNRRGPRALRRRDGGDGAPARPSRTSTPREPARWWPR